MTAPALVRAGIPLPGGRLIEIARDAGLPVLFSANAFMIRDANKEIVRVRMADREHFGNLNAALDSAGFVAAQKYRGYPWSVEQYLNLVQSYDWAFYSAMDLCVEPEIAGDQASVMFRLAETCRMFSVLAGAARDRGMSDPMPVLQGWTPSQYLWCADRFPIAKWPPLVGLGSMCRRHIHGKVGILAVLDALDRVMPPHVQFHTFGVKGPALEIIGRHPRIASTDSMAWDYACRRDLPTGRDMEVRGRYLLNWMSKNMAGAEGATAQHTPDLFPAEIERVGRRLEPWLDLVISNEISGPDAQQHAMRAFDHLPSDDEEEEEEETNDGELYAPSM